MNRPDLVARRSDLPTPSRRGFTIMEILVAVTITLILMAAVVQVFVWISTGVADARSTLEMQDRLRTVATRLQRDLKGATVTMLPPRAPENNEGYFEYTEGPMTDWRPDPPSATVAPPGLPRVPVNIDPPAQPDFRSSGATYSPDMSVGDVDDMLMFTTRSGDRPFTGRYTIQAGGAYPANDAVVNNIHVMTVTSQVAEVAWFIRGRTLYRRQLLVAPHLMANGLDSRGTRLPNVAQSDGFYRYYDISVRPQDYLAGQFTPVPNTLGDLTKPENRFCHLRYTRSGTANVPAYPHHPWGDYYWSGNVAYPWLRLGLPRMAECASNLRLWPACDSLSYITNVALKTNLTLDDSAGTPYYRFDAWQRPCPYANVDKLSGSILAFYDPAMEAQQATSFRVTDDVIMTNCIGFDVKAWDPGAPTFVRTLAAQGNTPARDVALAPGDPGYLAHLNEFRNDPNKLIRVAYGAYADLGYAPVLDDLLGTASLRNPPNIPRPHFHNVNVPPVPNGGVGTNNLYCFRLQRVYDTWTTHYETDGLAQPVRPNLADAGTNGFDNDGMNGPGDPAEADSAPPYPYPLRSIQVKIRVFEPDSRQIREVTVVQDFLPR